MLVLILRGWETPVASTSQHDQNTLEISPKPPSGPFQPQNFCWCFFCGGWEEPVTGTPPPPKKSARFEKAQVLNLFEAAVAATSS